MRFVLLTTPGVFSSAGPGVSTLSVDSGGRSAAGTPSPSHQENRPPEQAMNVGAEKRSVNHAIDRIALFELQ